jgi:cytochrome c553
MRTTAIIAILALGGLINVSLQAGDAGAGANAFSSRGCVGCHGVSGKKPIANYPVVGGKPAAFIAGELIKLRSGERKNPIMGPMAAGLSDADIDNLATYLEAQ